MRKYSILRMRTTLRLPYVTVLFTSGNAVSHGFSMFLYSALLPQIREYFQLSYTSASLVSAIFLLAYMGASIMSGALLTRLSARNVLILAICACPPLIALAALSPNIYGFTICLAIVSGCAVTHWNAIVDYTTENIAQSSRNKILGLSSSGGAFAICINGVLITLLMPDLGIPIFFILCSGITLGVALLTYLTLPQLELTQESSSAVQQPLNFTELFNTLRRNKLSLRIFAFCLLIGLFSGPYTTFISSFIVKNLSGDINQTGEVWFLIGLSGIFGGLLMGKISDKIDIIPSIQLFIFLFILSITYLTTTPSLIMTYISATIFGFLYFPIWGLIASYVSRYTNNKTGTLIISLSMVGYGIGNATSSALWGIILDYLSEIHSSISYQLLFAWVLSISIICLLYLRNLQKAQSGEMTPSDSSNFSAKQLEN